MAGRRVGILRKEFIGAEPKERRTLADNRRAILPSQESRKGVIADQGPLHSTLVTVSTWECDMEPGADGRGITGGFYKKRGWMPENYRGSTSIKPRL